MTGEDGRLGQEADRATHEPNPQAVSAVPVGIPDAAKPRVSLASFRLLELLWPYARQYDKPGQRSEIVADIFDGWKTGRDMAPLLADGLVYKVTCYDRSAPVGFRDYRSWNPTEKGERALFGTAPQGENP